MSINEYKAKTAIDGCLGDLPVDRQGYMEDVRICWFFAKKKSRYLAMPTLGLRSLPLSYFAF